MKESFGKEAGGSFQSANTLVKADNGKVKNVKIEYDDEDDDFE